MIDQYRILTTSEYESILDLIEKERLRVVVETLLNTGMRYSEFKEFSGHLAWFDFKNRAISLPGDSTKTGKGRVVHLTPAFSKRLYQYLREHKNLDVPSRQAMDSNLKRWMHEIGVSCKTFRKTWESWLIAAGYSSMAIALSQGHSELISYKHYANLDPRLKSEMDKVRKHTEGWGT